MRIDFIGHTVRRLNVQTVRLDSARPLHGGHSPATALLTAGAAAPSPDVTAVTDGNFIGLAARCPNVQPARRDGTHPLNNERRSLAIQPSNPYPSGLDNCR